MRNLFLMLAISTILFSCGNQRSKKNLVEEKENYSYVSKFVEVNQKGMLQYFDYECSSEIERDAAIYIDLCFAAILSSGHAKGSGGLNVLTILSDSRIVAHKEQCLSRYSKDLVEFSTALRKYSSLYFAWAEVEYSKSSEDFFIRSLITDF